MGHSTSTHRARQIQTLRAQFAGRRLESGREMPYTKGG
jgi:hypothetical protein